MSSTNGHCNGHTDGPLILTKTDAQLRAEAFNRGSDARIAGKSLWADPYAKNGHLTYFWRQGWHDVDNHWGEWARWPVAEIPHVRV